MATSMMCHHTQRLTMVRREIPCPCRCFSYKLSWPSQNRFQRHSNQLDLGSVAVASSRCICLTAICLSVSKCMNCKDLSLFGLLEGPGEAEYQAMPSIRREGVLLLSDKKVSSSKGSNVMPTKESLCTDIGGRLVMRKELQRLQGILRSFTTTAAQDAALLQGMLFRDRAPSDIQ